MYCGNVTRVLIFSQRNCFIQSRSKHFLENGSSYQNRLPLFFSVFLRNITSTIRFNSLSRGLKYVCAQYTVMGYLKEEVLKIPLCLKRHSVHIVRTCTQQCECVVAHRIRRGQQMFSLYSRLWDERALKELVSRMRQQLARRGKVILLGAIGFSSAHGDAITDEELQRSRYCCMDELESVYNLRNNTMTCDNCNQRQVVDIEVPSIIYCTCPGSKPVANKTSDDSEWIPFIERQDLLIWRKEESQGLYAYKVYGSYDDVSAADFFRVQVDIDYRKEWDTTAVKLEVLESDPQSNSDVIYWEMQWPRMFSNRDYVFKRRYLVDHERNLMVLVSKATTHPDRPESRANFRVTEYYSVMVIKPQHSFTEPGIEFSLTYYDNPGVTIPSAISSWVAKTGLTDFLVRLRVAARELACRRDRKECSDLDDIMYTYGVILDEPQDPERDLNEDPTIGMGEIESIPERIGDTESNEKPELGPHLPKEQPEGNEKSPQTSGGKETPSSAGGETSGKEDESGGKETTSNSGDKTSGIDDRSRGKDASNNSGAITSDEENGSGDEESPSQGNDEYLESDPKSREGQLKTSIYFTSFPYQDPPDVSYFQFHTANLFT